MTLRRARQDFRVSVTLKFSESKDADLLAWLADIQPGQRATRIKAILREALLRPAQPQPDTAEILDQLRCLPEKILASLQDLDLNSASQAKVSIAREVEWLSNEEMNRREQRIARATW